MKHIVILLSLLTLSACTTFKPQALNYSELTLDNKRKPLEYAVYTPPGWQRGERLPLIMFLHGGGGSHQSFEKYGAHLELDRLIEQGDIQRAIVVLPNGGNGFWENWADGTRHYRDWVIKGVLPAVQQEYQTLSCPEYCHIAGISMGGFGALRMANFHPDQFSSVTAMSAPIFTKREERPSFLLRLLIPFKRIFGNVASEEIRSTNPYYSWVDKRLDRKMRLQLIWGTNERQGIIDGNENFTKRLTEYGIEHEAIIYEGGHKWRYWVPQLEKVMRFTMPNSPAESVSATR